MSPVTYLWIALGGALGSVGRAWLALMVARLAGPQFPWGTILINVLGSFVIGFFGTLTAASDGRFAVSADARAFVMIGICGGFTTFSSFSLQTLELARDGRPGQALANVGFSLVLCLASVTAGHFGAASLNRGRVVDEAAQAMPAVPGHVVLAILDRPETTHAVLSVADRLLALAGSGRIDAVALMSQPAAALLPTEEVATRDRAETADGSARIAAMRAAFDEWTKRAEVRGLAAGWTEVEGPPGEIVTEHGRRADAVVLCRPGDRDDALGGEALHAALFNAGCPVLVVPTVGARTDFGQVVAIAWKEGERAAKAVQSAMPWLRQAKRVLVLQGEEGGAVSAAPLPVLAEHGIASAVVPVSAQGEALGAALLAAAHAAGADLLVMGAFAHGELRERVLGGVTRYMLGHADLPLLIRH